MEIKLSGVNSLKLTAKDGGGLPNRDTIIVFDTGDNPQNQIFEISAKELKAAIEALEKTCWRP